MVCFCLKYYIFITIKTFKFSYFLFIKIETNKLGRLQLKNASLKKICYNY